MATLQFSGATASQLTENVFDLVCSTVWKIESRELRRRLWRVLVKDLSREAANWRFQLRALAANHASRSDFERIIDTQFSPRRIIRWLERSVNEQQLSLSDANHAMECVLQRTNARGGWK
jgi:hypothetical protein